MCPVYAVLAAPLARPLGVRVLLWYAHWNRTRMLDAAVRASNAVVSVDHRSVPVVSDNVVGIGHGIDVSDFDCTEPPVSDVVRLAVLGRYSAAKGVDSIIHAVARARTGGLDVRLRAHGTAMHPREAANLELLRALVAELELGEWVELGGPLPRQHVPRFLAESTALVNNMRPGAPDKVVYEACAACRPVIVSNPLFDELLDDLEPALRFSLDDVEELAARIAAVGTLGEGERGLLGRTLRERVLDRHSVGSWADAVVGLCGRDGSSASR